MAIKLFILGRPGSGKSTAYRFIENFLSQHEQFKSWSVTRYNDYDILQDMFYREQLFPNPRKPKQFEAKEYSGFDVLDFTVLNTALINLEKRARERLTHKKEEVIIIEFARQDYNQAFKQFRPSFLKDSYFLFIEADVTTCVDRVKKRIANPPTKDNFFVSEFIMTEYYSKQLIPSVIKATDGDIINTNRVKAINSPGPLLAFRRKIEDFIKGIIVQESGYGELM